MCDSFLEFSTLDYDASSSEKAGAPGRRQASTHLPRARGRAGRLPSILNKQSDCRAEKSLPEHPYRPGKDSQIIATSLLPFGTCMHTAAHVLG